MPLMTCTRRGKRGWKFGANGHCYVGPGAKEKAQAQAVAIAHARSRRSHGRQRVSEYLHGEG
jgi:hypothetical protein